MRPSVRRTYAPTLLVAILGAALWPSASAQNHQRMWSREPHNEPIAQFKARGDPTGIIVRNGYTVAEWGDPTRVDMTFSVTKSFLSTTVGLAYDRGLIRDLNDTVRGYVPTGEFDSEHNKAITWDHLLRQTSDWEGTLWGKPDWAAAGQSTAAGVRGSQANPAGIVVQVQRRARERARQRYTPSLAPPPAGGAPRVRDGSAAMRSTAWCSAFSRPSNHGRGHDNSFMILNLHICPPAG